MRIRSKLHHCGASGSSNRPWAFWAGRGGWGVADGVRVFGHGARVLEVREIATVEGEGVLLRRFFKAGEGRTISGELVEQVFLMCEGWWVAVCESGWGVVV